VVRWSGGVGAGGDVEQAENLLLQGGELRREGLDVLAVAGEVVAGQPGEELEDAVGSGLGAGAVLGVERQLGDLLVGHRVA